MHTFASESMNSCFGTTQAKFNTKISRNESNYNLTPPVNHRKATKAMYVLMLTYNVHLYNNEDLELNEMSYNYNQNQK